MDEYLKRYHCEVLSHCVGCLMDSNYPDNITKLAKELMAACDEYVSDGFSMRVDKFDNGDMETFFLPANTNRSARISG